MRCLATVLLTTIFASTCLAQSGQMGKLAQSLAGRFETRCGWLSNPTPANISLYDRDEEWIIGVQGGYQVENEWGWPSFKPGQWVRTNAGSYGYGCACLRLRANRDTTRVLEIKSSQAKPLSACRNDRSLKKWNHLFK